MAAMAISATTAVEQYVRDSRIAMIYEGTNGIQALDLVGRKLPAHAGRYLRAFFHPLSAFVEANKSHETIGEMVRGLGMALGALQMATGHVAQTGMKDPEEAGAAASDYLRLFGLVALAFMWARMAKVAAGGVADGKRRGWFLPGQARHGAVLFRPHPARRRIAARGHQDRQSRDHGIGRSSILTPAPSKGGL